MPEDLFDPNPSTEEGSALSTSNLKKIASALSALQTVQMSLYEELKTEARLSDSPVLKMVSRTAADLHLHSCR